MAELAEESWRPGRLTGPWRTVLLESRQRWRDLVLLGADLVFELDENGCFSFVAPDSALGWSADELLGQPASALVVARSARGADPFRPRAQERRQRLWLRRGDGGTASVVLSIAPQIDRLGRLTGARGLITDITGQEAFENGTAAAMRRCEVIEHVLSQMRQEVLAPRMMNAMLRALSEELEAEGAAVIAGEGNRSALLRAAGEGAHAIVGTAQELMQAAEAQSGARAGLAEGRPLLVASCLSALGGLAGLALWREAGRPQWDENDKQVAAAAAGIVRLMLEHEAIHRDMASQTRTDPLTSLANRRAFLEELPRHIDRLDREQTAGTLMLLDLDRFAAVNDRLGHERGDQILCCMAEMLRNAVRPTDLVARLGGDEFAVWLNGADHLTAAERAEQMRVQAPRRFAELAPGIPALGVSTGIATRHPGSGETIEGLLRRSNQALQEVKGSGRGHWRVALAEAR